MPGVGHQHLHRPVLGLDLAERGVDGRGVGDVAGHREQPLRQVRDRAAVGHRHLVALRGERPRDRQPDPPVAPGHQHAASSSSPTARSLVRRSCSRVRAGAARGPSPTPTRRQQQRATHQPRAARVDPPHLVADLLAQLGVDLPQLRPRSRR